MKVLTGIATIFIPLGLVASIYGMNFTPEKSAWNMLELNWHWGYPLVSCCWRLLPPASSAISTVKIGCRGEDGSLQQVVVFGMSMVCF